MTSEAARPDEADLHAYADGRLSPARQAEVEAWLAGDAVLAATAAHFRAQNEALHALYDPLLERAAPAILETLALRRRQRAARLATFGRVAAVLALMAASAAGGWYARTLPETTNGTSAELAFAEAGVSAHRVYEVEVRHAVEVPFGEADHLTRWLSKRLAAPLLIPDLVAQGYTLMGGRLLPAGGLPAAHFLYETAAGDRLTLYMQPNSDPATSFHFAEEEGISAVFWREGRLAYAVIGRGERAAMLSIASAVYSQINP